MDNLRESSSRIVQQIHRVIANALVADVDHLREVEADVDPRHEAFWFVGGITSPKMVVRFRNKCSWQRVIRDEPVN